MLGIINQVNEVYKYQVQMTDIFIGNSIKHIRYIR